jgi:Zn-dependent peptidase ImmA (M78 family)
MGLRATDPLDPRDLAAHLEIPVAAFSDFLAVAPGVAPLLKERSSEVSAATIHRGPRRLVLVNDSHVPERQNSSVAHELAHALLQHAPRPALDEFGCRHWNGEVEEEAAWLGGVLLITNEGARAIIARRFSDHTARERYGVSQEMLNWRKRMSGGMRMNRAA